MGGAPNPPGSETWRGQANSRTVAESIVSVTSLAGLDRPWQKLARRIGEPELRFLLGGGVYLARFVVPTR